MPFLEEPKFWQHELERACAHKIVCNMSSSNNNEPMQIRPGLRKSWKSLSSRAGRQSPSPLAREGSSSF